MIEKINELKTNVNSKKVKQICENAINTITSALYNGVTSDAKHEIERVTISNLFKDLAKRKESGVNEWVKTNKRLFTIKNLGIREAINSLNETEDLRDVLDNFKDVLNRGVHETRLYEEFISALSPFGYFPTVGNAIQSINDRVDKYKTDVDITKIIETMKESKSNYLIPLIEDVVNNYLSNKNAQTKSQLTETLIKFTYDPFVRDLVSLVSLDAKELHLEYANAQCDIDKIYSPVLYLKENEAIFAVNNSYYIKKGNNVSKLPEVEILQLDNEFKTLCETLSMPNISIDRKGLTVYFGNDKAFIDDDGVLVNEQLMSNDEFQHAADVAKWGGNLDFYRLVEFLQVNFKEIGEVDFVKRIYLKEDINHSADIFKLRDNVFININDSELNKSTFYRNVNPIQAKNIMMEHLNYDVTSLYQGLLPDEQKINNQINETKNSYNDYIKDLEGKINNFSNSYSNNETNQTVILALTEELKDVKDEYKDYLNHIENYTRAISEETISVDINVGSKKYTVPIPTEAGAEAGVEKKVSQETGTVVGQEHIEDAPASSITFDDDDTELLGDTPSMDQDKVDLGVKDVEDEADEAEVEAEEKEEENAERAEEESEAPEEEEALKDEIEKEGDEIKIEDEQDSIENDDKEDVAKQKDKKKTRRPKFESGEGEGLVKRKKKVFLRKRAVVESGEGEEGMNKKKDNLEEGTISPDQGEGAILIKQGESNYSDTPNHKRYKLKDGKIIDVGPNGVIEVSNINVNESAQILDSVMFNKQKGSVIGQTNNGDLIIQVQGSTHLASQADVQVMNPKVETIKPPFKFSKETQKLLFEQYVKCGIYMDRTPVKISDCYVRYSDWKDSNDEDPVNVIVEGQCNLLSKNQIRIFEDVNDFANLDNYVEGVTVNELTGDAVENVKINVEDYTNTIGDAEPVRIIRGGESETPEVDTVPKASLRTLSI